MKFDLKGTTKKTAATILCCMWLAAVIMTIPLKAMAADGHKDPEFTNTVVEKKIWSLLDESKPTFVSLSTPDFMALGEGFDIPDRGKSITDLATAAPGGAFRSARPGEDPGRKDGIQGAVGGGALQTLQHGLGYLGSEAHQLEPGCEEISLVHHHQWRGGELVRILRRPEEQAGLGSDLAQKINVMIVTIPGNFKYGGWTMPIMDEMRQPQYLLDRDLPMPEINLRNALVNNQVVMQGLKQLIMKDTTGDILISGHSTSGELAMLSLSGPRSGGAPERTLFRMGQRRPSASCAEPADSAAEKPARGWRQ